MKFLTICFFIISFSLVNVYAQDLGHGDALYRAKNTHSGNLVRLTFYNYGTVGSKNGSSSLDYSGEWPIGSGKTSLGSAEPFIISEVYVGKDASGIPQFLHPCIFSEGWDPSAFSTDPLNGKFWGFEPLPGFLNQSQKEADPSHAVAMSHQAATWPSFWPDRTSDANDPGWPGHWNGYFGKDQRNADQESFFAMDDYVYAKPFGSYSLPLPDSSNTARKGLGLRMFGRGLQWSNPDAQDVVFWLFTIENIGNLYLDRTLFGFNVGSSNGGMIGCSDAGISSTAGAAYYRDEALAVNFSTTNVGCGGYTPVPWVGYSFLESPGNPFDGIDNDADGSTGVDGVDGHKISTGDFTRVIKAGEKAVLIDYNSKDYKRTIIDMPADSLVINFRHQNIVLKPVVGVNPPQYILSEIDHNGMDDNLNGIIDESDGYKNSQDGSSFYLYIYNPVGNPRDYFAKDYLDSIGLSNKMIDERRDDGIDNNNNWDPRYDDVGLDGMPGTGDYGEGDGIPTSGYQPSSVATPAKGAEKNIFGLYDTGLPGEPNTDKTDVTEGDQIGLTAFKFYQYGALAYDNDDQMYLFNQPGVFDSKTSGLGDYDYVYSCGYFPLLQGQTEFFSVALIFGLDESEMLRNKVTVQKIYNSNYNFAVAPTVPVVKAVAGDGKVTLTWGSESESSFDRYLHTYNFEGYKIYRGTYQTFADAGKITDGYGYDRYVKPIAIYDKVDGVEGFFPLDFGTGVLFNLGKETGLTHEYVDNTVTNGVKYYYAVTAYTAGSASANIGPAETSMFVNTDAAGNVSLGQNVVTATPQAGAAGYKAADFDMAPTPMQTDLTSGVVGVNILDPDKIKSGDTYEIQFLDPTMDKHFDGKTPLNDTSRLTPTYTTGFILNNKTQNVAYDTVWIYKYATITDTTNDSTTYVQLQNLYQDTDKDNNTFTADVNGMRIFVYNPPKDPGTYNNEEKGILNGIKGTGRLQDQSVISMTFKPFELSNYQNGYAYPRSYKIVFYDTVVTQSSKVPILNTKSNTIANLAAVNANFKVYDMNTGEEVPFGFSDVVRTGSLAGKAPRFSKGFFSVGDYIVLYEKLKNDSTLITWQIRDLGTDDSLFYNVYGAGPGAGDTLYLYTDMPFTGKSKYTFKVKGESIDTEAAKESLDNIKVVPNPYVAASLYDPQNPYSTGRGYRKVYFTHLPQKCTINIYAVDGTLVRTLYHDGSMRDGSEEWNLQNRDNMEVAYGVYVYHIDAPGIGEHIGKIMLIK
jgi:hypothetical protein